LICVLTQVYPFGNKTLLISDLSNQYVDYFAYYKTIFIGKNDFLYTFSKNLGGDMVGFSAYYLLSPLNFILFFFTNDMLPVGLMILIILKNRAVRFNGQHFLSKIYRQSYSSILFSSSYSLMAYNIAYFFNIMWLDGVILTPLIALGIDRLIRNKKTATYVLSLFAALVINFYIGFILCIFSVIYFLYKFFLSINIPGGFEAKWNIIIRYIIASAASVGLSAFILIPTFYSLQNDKAKILASGFSFKAIFNLTNIIDKLKASNGLPIIIFCILAAVLLIINFCRSKISFKKKIRYACLLSFLIIPVFFSLGLSLSKFKFKENFNLIDIFSKLFTNSLNWNQITGGLPNIFAECWRRPYRSCIFLIIK
jgi:Predicted membrane protein